MMTRTRSIQTRLLITSLLLVLLPIAATATVSTLLSYQNSRARAQEQLAAIATLKKSEIEDWVQRIKSSLLLARPAVDQISFTKLLLTAPTGADTAVYRLTYEREQARYANIIAQEQLFSEIFMLDLNGRVTFSTDSTQVGNTLASSLYGPGLSNASVTPPFYSEVTGITSMLVVVPILDTSQSTIGMLAGRVNLEILSAFMLERSGLGNTGETYLLDKGHRFLTQSLDPAYTVGGERAESQASVQALDNERSGEDVYVNYRGRAVFGTYYYLPELRVALFAEQEQAEALRTTYQTIYVNLGITLLAVGLAFVASLYATRRITKPLANLARTAEQIAAGDLQLNAEVEQADEIGALAKSFNAMTAQIRSLVSGLELRVASRTDELERRSLQIRVAAEVARDATAIRNLDELLDRAVNLIQERFGFYHTAIVLLDDRREYAVLRGASGAVGKQLVSREFKLPVGGNSIIGYVTGLGQPRVVPDVDKDPVYLKEELLPLTRSEMALPLKLGAGTAQEVIGALDVQSDQPQAFDEDSIEVLQTLSDQLAVAIESARLFKEMQQALDELEMAYGRYTQETWQKLRARAGQQYGYRYRGADVELVTDTQQQAPEMREALQKGQPVVAVSAGAEHAREAEGTTSVAVPLRLRGQVVGGINLRLKGEHQGTGAASDSAATPEFVSIFEEIANRLALAMDNARLLGETQFRTEQLRLLQDITSTAATHLRLGGLLDDMSDKVRAGYNLHATSILLFDPTQGEDKQPLAGTILAASTEHTGGAATEGQAEGQPRSGGNEIVGQRVPIADNKAAQSVLKAAKALAFQDVQKNAATELMRDLFKIHGTRSLALVPIMARNEIIGLILLESTNPQQRFTDDDLRLADQIGLQIGTAVDVVRIFEQTERRAARERQISEVTARIRETLDIETVLRTAAQEVRQVLGLPEVAVRLATSDRAAQPNATEIRSSEKATEL
jgi:GAF domain-containing protein/HAMP domain-containing protein